MVTYVGVSGSASLLSRSLSLPGQLLLAEHCSQQLPPIQGIGTFTEDNDDKLAGNGNGTAHPVDPFELINATVPRVSCFLLEASMALSEKRIEDLCSQLAQASAILDDVLAVVCPQSQITDAEVLMSMPDAGAPVKASPVEGNGEPAHEFVVPRAMAAAA